MRVLLVCMGNICRSPMAQGVFERVFADHLGAGVDVDSAGTHGYHVGSPPDPRAQDVCRAAGIDISAQRARQLEPADADAFDYILVMDEDNLDAARRVAGHGRARVDLLLDYAPERRARTVPDPYYGGDDGFGLALSLIDAGIAGFRAAREGDGSLRSTG